MRILMNIYELKIFWRYMNYKYVHHYQYWLQSNNYCSVHYNINILLLNDLNYNMSLSLTITIFINN